MAKQKYWDGTKWVQVAPSMQEFNEHKADYATFKTNTNTALSGKESTLPVERKRKITYGTDVPSGGEDGDVYLQYE